MPLVKGKSEKSFKKNVETEMHEGKPLKQSLAIAYDVQRRAKKKKMAHGGKINEEVSMKSSEHTEEPKGVHPGAKKHYEKPSEKEFMSSHKPHGSLTPKHDSEDAPAEAEYLGIDATGKHRFAMGGKVITAIGREHYPHPSEKEYMSGHNKMLAKGGKVEDEHSRHPEHFIDEEEHEVDAEEHIHDEDHPKSIADAVMHKMKKKNYAKGGKVHKEEDGDIDDPFDADDEGITHFDEEGPATRQKYNMVARNYKAGDDSQLKKQPKDSNEHGDAREHDEEDEHDADMVSKIRHKMKKRGY
jgi:hypothetical protein